jgi:hypothetical protein
MARKGKLVEAVAYMRASSAANAGADKDSEQRQRRAITGYAKRAGMVLVAEFNDRRLAVPTLSKPGPASRLCLTVSRETACASSLSKMPRGSPVN